MFAERSGDGQAREDAFRSMNYATSFTGSDGRISYCGVDYHNPYWFSDGYADYLRHFNWTMGALPDLAPAGQDHVLRSSSVIQKVAYTFRRVTYKTFDAAGRQVLRLSFKPEHVTSGGKEIVLREDLREPGYTVAALPGGDYVVRVGHQDSGDIVIEAR
jgi:hypothetical protein